MTSSPPASAQPTKRGLPRGEVDVAEGFLGIPQCGKSALMTRRALELAAASPAYIIAHDAERQYRPELPGSLGGWKTGLAHFDSVAACDAYITKHGEVACGRLLAIHVPDGTEVVAFAHAVAARSLARTPGGNGPAPHVVLIIDEVANCNEMQPNYIGPTLKAALTMRRHRHTALLWSTQDPDCVHRDFLRMRTALYIFRIEAPDSLTRLQRQAKVKPEALQLVSKLNQYEYIVSEPEGFRAPL